LHPGGSPKLAVYTGVGADFRRNIVYPQALSQPS